MNLYINTRFKLLTLLITVLLLAGYEISNRRVIEMPTIDMISAEEWKSFTNKRIVFGHQSVGANILSGIKELASQAGINLTINGSRRTLTSNGITHFNIGQNGEPLSKINDFESAFETDTSNVVDVAIMKLCYIDFNKDTDVNKLAEDYVSTLGRLSNKFKNTTFIPVTAPITTVQTGPRALIKHLLGREPGGYSENLRRKEFNDILRNKLGNRFKIFDLAKIESDGTVNVQFNRETVEVLNPTITSDGGHLNSLGEKYIAAKLVKFISALPVR